MVLIQTTLALQHQLQLCRSGLLHCPIEAKHISRVYLSVFHRWRFSAGLASLHSSLQLLYFSWVKKSNITAPFASQNTLAITLPEDGCDLNFFGLGDQALPTDDSELYSLAHNNEPKFHLQSSDTKENHLLT